MKNIFTGILILLAGVSTAQIDNRIETDCTGASRSIYAVLGEGKPLVVASKGFDCSVCISHAGEFGDFADTYQGQIEVWGAMNYTYSSQTPTCSTTGNWIATHGWGNIFTFVDEQDYWLEIGTPRYYVVDPTSQEIVYEGPSINTATSTAVSLISTVGVSDYGITQESFKVFANGETVQVNLFSTESLIADFEIYNILGQKMANHRIQIQNGENNLVFPFSETEGIFIANIAVGGERISKKFVLRKP